MPTGTAFDTTPGSGPSAVLVFSGGATKRNQTSLTEASSYAAALRKLTEMSQLRIGAPVLLEEDATDSYQNLLFSIILYRRTYGTYPINVTVVSHAFKTERFFSFHGPAIAWPADRLSVVGIDPPMTSLNMRRAISGEQVARDAWLNDPYGKGAELDAKRKSRGWDDAAAERICEGLDIKLRWLLSWAGGSTGVQPLPQGDSVWTEHVNNAVVDADGDSAMGGTEGL